MIAPATLLSCLVCYAALCSAIPTPQDDAKSTSVTSSSSEASSSSSSESSNVQGKQESTMSSSHTVSSANGLLVKMSERKVNNECVSKLTIFGNGIDKSVEYPCGKAPVDIINLKSGLAVGDEWFTDEPKTLVHLMGNQCQKELFTEKDGKITSTSETLSEEECQKVHAKIGELKKKQQEWKEWLVQQEQAAQQQLQQMQQNFSQMFSNIFGG